jgi:hypothetical protein
MVTGQPVHRAEDPFEVAALHGEQIESAPRRRPASSCGEDHLAHRRRIGRLFEEHVLRAAEPDPLGAQLRALAASWGESALARTLQRAHLVDPAP